MSDLEMSEKPPEVAPRRNAWLLTLTVFLVLVGLAAGAAVVLSDDEADGPQPLGLLRGTDRDESSGAPAADAMYPYQKITYRLDGELPDLGSEAPVYRVVAPDLDAAGVTQIAKALGIDGAPEDSGEGWCVPGDDAALMVEPGPGGWFVSYVHDEWVDGCGARTEPGSSGGGSSGSVGGTVAPDGTSSSDEPSVAPGEPYPGDTPTTAPGDDPMPGDDPKPVPDDVIVVGPTEPEDLPSEAEAKTIAEELLDAMGVTDGAEWQVEVTDGGMAGVAVDCSEGSDCEERGTTSFVTSRSVTFFRVVDGRRVHGLEWSVEVGDKGVVGSVYGTLADLQKVDDYPLRSTKSVYDDLVSGEGFYPGPVPMYGGDDVAVQSGVAVDVATRDQANVAGEAEVTVATEVAPTPCEDDCTYPEPQVYECREGDEKCAVPPVYECPDDTTDADCAAPPPPDCVVQPDGTEPCLPPTPPPTVCDDVVTSDDEGSVDPATGVTGATTGDGSTEPGAAGGSSGGVDSGTGCIVDPPVTIEPMPEPMPEPEPVVVVITGAELGYQLMPAMEGDEMIAYVVPTYRFLGTWESGDGEYTADLVAIDEALVAPPTTEPVEPPVTSVPPDTKPPVTAEPPVTTDPPMPTTTVVSGEAVTVTVLVSNQSFEVPDADITVTVDGEPVADDEFAVGNQHSWTPFELELAPGEHELIAFSEAGGAKIAQTFVVDGETWLVVSFWGMPGGTGDQEATFTVTESDTQPMFD